MMGTSDGVDYWENMMGWKRMCGKGEVSGIKQGEVLYECDGKGWERVMGLVIGEWNGMEAYVWGRMD